MNTDPAALTEQVRAVLDKVLSDALEFFRPEDGDLYPHAEADALAALDALVDLLAEAELRANINGLGKEPSDAGGPFKEEAYWQRRKLDAAIRHMRDLEDYFRLAGGAENSPNQIRADRVRAIYEQISDDYLNGKTYRPTMVERAEAAEALLAELEAALAEIARPMPETDGDWGSTYDWEKSAKARRDIARAALADGEIL